MARPKKVVEEPKEEPKVEPEKVTPEVVEPVETGKKAVIYKGGSVVREYTPEIHGKGYKALATEFAEKKGYEVRLK